MRLLLLMLGISVCVVGIGTRAEAQNYPWCAIYSGGMGGGGTNCGFITFEQCMDTARGLGSFCQPNTQYVPPPGPHPQTNVRRRYLRTNSGSFATLAARRTRLIARAFGTISSIKKQTREPSINFDGFSCFCRSRRRVTHSP